MWTLSTSIGGRGTLVPTDYSDGHGIGPVASLDVIRRKKRKAAKRTEQQLIGAAFADAEKISHLQQRAFQAAISNGFVTSIEALFVSLRVSVPIRDIKRLPHWHFYKHGQIYELVRVGIRCSDATPAPTGRNQVID